MPTKSKAPAPITPDQTTSEAFATILQHNLLYLIEWEGVARSWEEIEGVHQVRVTIRRMRSAVSLFQSAVPKSATREVRQELRWIGGELGPARDLDVFLSQTLTAISPQLPLSGAEKLRARAEQRRAQVYRDQVCAMLDSARYQRFKESFGDWIARRAWERATLKKKVAKRLHGNIIPYARKLLDKQERQVLAAGSHLDRQDAAAMHRLRIECKKLRYAAEFFRPLFPELDTFIDHMKGLQDLLGVMNDGAVTQHLLDELLAQETDQETLIHAGGVIGWQRCDLRHLLDRFDPYWERFLEVKHPWWNALASSKTR